tara:strand:- start:133 stop:552 length:420 start_codon:yes stop_codon:yes gene_type:complete
MQVEVYKNLHKNCWSVRNNKTGLVIGYVKNIHLENATFIVRPAGRARVLRERRKNVHAFIKGNMGDSALVDSIGLIPYKDLHIHTVTYNPYLHTSFMIMDRAYSEEPIHQADHVFLTGIGKVYAQKHNLEDGVSNGVSF